MTTTTTTITTTNPQYGLVGAKYCSGSIMGLTQDDGDNTVDIIYSTSRKCEYFKCYEYFYN